MMAWSIASWILASFAEGAHGLAAAAGSLGLVSPLLGHFLFVVPEAPDRARVVMSENLAPDPRLRGYISRFRKYLNLWGQGAAGAAPVPLALGEKQEGAFHLELPPDLVAITGHAEVGVNRRPGEAAHALIYHPRTILAEVGAATLPPAIVALEPLREAGTVRLVLSIEGRPVPQTEVVIVEPDGTWHSETTDGAGRTPPLAATGWYGAWARYWQPVQEERQGQAVESLHHYATLVVRV